MHFTFWSDSQFTQSAFPCANVFEHWAFSTVHIYGCVVAAARKQAIKAKCIGFGIEKKRGNAKVKVNTHHDMLLTMFIIAHCSLLILSVILCKMYSIHASNIRPAVQFTLLYTLNQITLRFVPFGRIHKVLSLLWSQKHRMFWNFFHQMWIEWKGKIRRRLHEWRVTIYDVFIYHLPENIHNTYRHIIL